MTAAGRLAFTTTQRVVNRVHSNTTSLGAHAFPPVPPGLSNRDQLVLSVPDLSDSGSALDGNFAHLRRWKPERRIIALFGNQLYAHSRTAG